MPIAIKLEQERDMARRDAKLHSEQRYKESQERDQLMKFVQAWLDGGNDKFLHALWHKEIKDAVRVQAKEKKPCKPNVSA